MTAVEHVAPGAWRATVAAALAGGERFGGGWASGGAWRVLLLGPGTARVLSCDAPVDTIVDLVEAAAWDEREAHDLYGLRFAGHVPLRALVAHPDDPHAWMTPVTGDGVHDVAVGPIHAGVIESGHFRFHVVGERVLALDPRLFYKHRGLERAAEGLPAAEALRYAQRACAACAVANSVAYAHAVEDALGLWPDRELRVARTLALELERLYNHLHDIGAICAGVGFAPGTQAFAALKERAQRINALVAGHRFLFDCVAVGGGGFAVDAATAAAARAQLRELAGDAAAAWRELEFTGSLQARLDGVGVLGHDDALRLGTVGPAARAAGVRRDAREDSSRLWYGDFTPARPPAPSGDVAARLQLRAAELQATGDALDDLLARAVEPGTASASRGTGATAPGAGSAGTGAATRAAAGAGTGAATRAAAGAGTRAATRAAAGAGTGAATRAAAGAGTGAATRAAAGAGGGPGGRLGVGCVESPRGATVCAVELAGDRVARLHLRTGSYANWPAVAHAATGNLLPDFPLINKSFELCYACVDR